MEIVRVERYFGIKLAAGSACAPGNLINVSSSGTGRIASDTSSYYAHGIALTSGSGTKKAGIAQYVRCSRHAQVDNIVSRTGASFVKGETVYLGSNGDYASGAPGTINQKVGFALDTDEVFVDLDCYGLPA
jgi:hypothetical protein